MEVPKSTHVGISVLLVALAMLIDIIFEDVTIAFEIVGGFCLGMTGITVPLLIKVALSQEPWHKGQNLIITGCNLLLTIGCLTSSTMAVIELFD